MSLIIAKTGQNIFDVAFTCYGEYNVLKLMAENSFITDLAYTDFAGKTINFTPTKNNASFAQGLSKKIMNTGNSPRTGQNNVWDGFYDIWDGTYLLAY